MSTDLRKINSLLDGTIDLPSPLQRLESDLWLKKNIEVYIKRDDLIHPEISGNKWRKLKYNLSKIIHDKTSGIATVGGAYSNHLAATAQAASLLDMPCLGYVKCYELDVGNPTLQFCLEKGMRLERISRDLTDDILKEKATQNGFDFVPEGGSNALGVRGVSELLKELPKDQMWDFIFTSVGSGGTIAGLATGLSAQTKLCGISSFPSPRITAMLNDRFSLSADRYEHFDQYRFGGFGKYEPVLIDFAERFYKEHGIVLDPIYTTKTMFGLYNLISSGWVFSGSRVLFLHTGGIQGWKGFSHRFQSRALPCFLS